MVDIPLEGIFADEEAGGEGEHPQSPGAPDAFASVLAANLPLTDPGVAQCTREFLEKQTRLLDLQAHHLEDLHSLQVAHMQGQKREGRLRRAGMRIRLAFQIFFAAFATVIAIACIVMLRDATTSRAVIIESFQTPPDLAGRGINGEVVASSLLDELTKLQRATRSSSATLVASGAWSGDIRIEIPETGLSVGEVYRAIRARFGHDVHIDGDLVQGAKEEASLTVRGPGIAAKSFSGTSGDLGALATQAAEYVYSQSQPARWGAYLMINSRYKETLEFCRSSLEGQDDETRARLLGTWALAAQFLGESAKDYLPLLESALRLKPDLWPAYSNIIGAYQHEGREEDAWRYGVAMEKRAGGRPGKVPELYYANLDLLTGNFGTIVQAIKDDEKKAVGGTHVLQSALELADMHVRLHDPNAANLDLQELKGGPADNVTAAGEHYTRGTLAAEEGDMPRAIGELRAFAALHSPDVDALYPGFLCVVAPIEEASGNSQRADELLAKSGTYVDCYRFHADILDRRGDWAGAQAAYARAVALAPDLPAAYYSWGVALLRHQDLAGAEAKLADAQQRGPHWADPLKVWGDLLALQGRKSEARQKYDAALKEAPNWRELAQARAKVN